ncbi:hypothetical protein ACS0TY_023074 [Phlomoides rotata]
MEEMQLGGSSTHALEISEMGPIPTIKRAKTKTWEILATKKMQGYNYCDTTL